MTSHSYQGPTERRVIVNVDTGASRNLINSRLAYVAISRAETDARIYTKDAANLGTKLAGDIAKTSAVNFQQKRAEEPFRSPIPGRRSYEYPDPNTRLTAVAHEYTIKPQRTVALLVPASAFCSDSSKAMREALIADYPLTRVGLHGMAEFDDTRITQPGAILAVRLPGIYADVANTKNGL